MTAVLPMWPAWAADAEGGKSELRRAVRRVTPGRGNSKDSGTENIPPAFALGPSGLELRRGKPFRGLRPSGFGVASPSFGVSSRRLATASQTPRTRACLAEARGPKARVRRRVRVKRCGKSAPRTPQGGWQAKPRTEQGQIGRRSGEGRLRHRLKRTARPKSPGRSLEPVSNAGPRGMVVVCRNSRKAVKAETEFGLRFAATNFFRG